MRILRSAIFVLTFLGVLLTAGCPPLKDDVAKHNTAVHKNTDAATAGADKINTLVTSARTWLADLITTLKAYAVDPVHNPFPTTQQITRDATNADAQLALVPAQTTTIKTASAAAASESDQQKTASDIAIKNATDAQKKKDDHDTGYLIAGAVALLVWLVCERSTMFTFVTAIVPGLIAGCITLIVWLEFVDVLRAWARGIAIAAMIAVTIGGVTYIIYRFKTGGFAAIFKNTELTTPLKTTAFKAA